jgi:hypothetical protein
VGFYIPYIVSAEYLIYTMKFNHSIFLLSYCSCSRKFWVYCNKEFQKQQEQKKIKQQQPQKNWTDGQREIKKKIRRVLQFSG